MSGHTKEPWRYRPSETEEDDGHTYAVTGANITGADSESIFRIDLGEMAGLDDANARRIVACVNACAGVTDEQFDGGWTAQGISDYAKRLEQQRDDLLAQLKQVEALSETHLAQRDRLLDALKKIGGFTLSQFMGPHDMALECRNVARAAISSIEQHEHRHGSVPMSDTVKVEAVTESEGGEV